MSPAISSTLNTSTKDKRTVTLLLARFGSKVRLEGAEPTPGLRSALKVKTLDDSLRSCLLKKQSSISRRASLTLENLGSSLRNLFGGSGRALQGGDNQQQHQDDVRAASHGTGMDMLLGSEEPTLVFDPSSDASAFATANKSVRFSTLERRLYSVAPSDNPSVSGIGPAIALDGWSYETIPCQDIDEYETFRQESGTPRKKQEDLKLSMMDRIDRLKEHGANSHEIQVFAKRVQKAKMKRAKTVEAFALYGKRHQIQEEKRENTKRWFQKLFRLRKQQGEEQVALWENAQQQTQQMISQSSSTTLTAATA